MITMKQSYEIEYDGTHNVCRMEIYADTAADLTGLDNLDGVYFLAGSSAYDISTGDTYMMNTSGTWILQPSANQFENVYKKTEVDNIVSDINADIADNENDISKLHSAVNEILLSGGKNKLQITATDRTHNGVTFTVNADGTITANGTATANAYIPIANIPAQGGLFDGAHMMSGSPPGGSRQSYAMYAALSNYARYDYGSGVSLIPTELTGSIGIVIMVYAGYTAENVIFKPMISTFSDWDISTDFAPYCPTLAELYALVKSYHP